MTDPGFRIEQRQRTLPFLPRGTYADYWTFSDAGRTLLVEPDAAKRIRETAQRACPHETGGLLAGRSLRDDEGQYIVVSGFTEAKAGSGAPAAFKIPVEDLGTLRTENARAYPGADEVGWWHSHSGPGGYSTTDRENQRMFDREDSVGLLVFANGFPWGTAYIGPESVNLGSPRRGHAVSGGGSVPMGVGSVQPGSGHVQLGNGHVLADSGGIPGPRVGPGAAPEADAGSWPRLAREQWRIVFLSAVAFLSAVIIAGIALLVLHSRGGNGETASAPNWSCSPSVTLTQPQPGAPPPAVSKFRYYDCTATGSPGRVVWLGDGEQVQTGRRVRIPIGAPTRVQPELMTANGTVVTGSARTLSP